AVASGKAMILLASTRGTDAFSASPHIHTNRVVDQLPPARLAAMPCPQGRQNPTCHDWAGVTGRSCRAAFAGAFRSRIGRRRMEAPNLAHPPPTPDMVGSNRDLGC